MQNEITEERLYRAFNTQVEVVYSETFDSATTCQKRNVEKFFEEQSALTPKIVEAVFEDYKRNYEHYRSGSEYFATEHSRPISEEELEQTLPKPTTAEALLKFYKPVAIYVQSARDCVDGTVGIAFETTWDMKSELGVTIRNWTNLEVGTQHVAFFP